MNNDFVNQLGQPTPLFAVQALSDDPPAGLSDKQKRRLDGLAARYERNIRAEQRERYAEAVKVTRETQSLIEASIEQNNTLAREINEAMSHGRGDTAQAHQDLAQVFRETERLRERYAGLERSESDAWEMVCTDPDEYQMQRLERFPSLKNSLPRISQAWLDGSDETDPLA